ncbi:MAG: phage portal protein [Clostridia bacterium]|nr:phage portal protein [Clostridia bacterium]
MNLEAFMIEEKEEVVEYVASLRFKDKEGNPIPWKLKSITAKENDELRKQCYKQVQVSGKRSQYKQDFDTSKYLELLALKCIVEPNLNDAKLQDFYHVMKAEDLLKEHLLKPAEYDNLVSKLQEINGYDLEEAVEEAKN